MKNSVADLLEQLNRGNAAAAEEVFRRYEPYLRMMIRRQLAGPLRAKFDSVDIVQSVWADLLRGFRAANWQFDDAAQLKAFLVKATRNRFLNRIQRHRREKPLGEVDLAARTPSHEPRPSEVAQRDELWERLLRLCTPAHREILHLRRQGLLLAEIAARTGFHQSSVRRILYDLARRL